MCASIFFQAEDGIRGRTVTGVQTCALPIYFRLGMHYFLKNEDHTAARQLIFIGEQNNVRAQLEPAEQKVYAQLFEKYNGKTITDDTHEFLENYERIVRLIGKSFPNTGIEILLHNLADPSHSLT